MEWRQIGPIEYEDLGLFSTVFHSSAFNELNAGRAAEVKYLCLQTSEFICGLIVGKRNDQWFSPFSAPFGGIEYVGFIHKSTKAAVLRDLKEFLLQNSIFPLHVTLPPEGYSKELGCFDPVDYLNEGFIMKYSDVNFHIELDGSDYSKKLQRNARKNLNQAVSFLPELILCSNDSMEEEAYEIIRQNRSEKGYPLKMSYSQIKETKKAVEMFFYILRVQDANIAAALVYHISPRIAMVVYWGHLEKYNDFRPINALSWYLVNHYKDLGYKILDIGPSSEFGVLNEGLANFKRSIGCVQTQKMTIIYDQQ